MKILPKFRPKSVGGVLLVTCALSAFPSLGHAESRVVFLDFDVREAVRTNSLVTPDELVAKDFSRHPNTSISGVISIDGDAKRDQSVELIQINDGDQNQIRTSVSYGNWEEIRRLELAYLTLSAVDLAQTHYCLEQEQCRELNPVYGADPSFKKLMMVKAAGGIAHFFLMKVLAENHPKISRPAIYASLLFQAGIVGLNSRFIF